MSGQLDDGEFDFEDAEQTLENDDEGLVGKARGVGEDAYDFVKDGIGKSGAVTVPAGAGAAAATGQPVEMGAGAGLSASMLYNAAKAHVESEYGGLDAKDAGILGGIAGMGPVGGYAVSKRDEVAEAAGNALDSAKNAAGEAYGVAADMGADAVNYAATQGPQVVNDVAASSDEAALGIGAGLAAMLGGAYGIDKVEDKLGGEEEFESDYEKDW